MSDIYSRGPHGNEIPNTSGQGLSAELPSGLGQLNWGAFALGWIWGLGNRTFIALLGLLPLVNVVMAFVLLFKGNQWAWQNATWRDLSHFRGVQRKWAIAAAIFYGAAVLLVGGVLMGEFISGKFETMITDIGKLEPVVTAKREATTNTEIAQYVGSPVVVDQLFTGTVSENDQSGNADITVSLSGPLASGSLRTVSIKWDGVWIVQTMVLTLDDSGQVTSLTPPGK